MSLIPVYRPRPSPLHAARAGVGALFCCALALIGAGWGASYVGTLANRETIVRIEAETVRSQEISRSARKPSRNEVSAA